MSSIQAQERVVWIHGINDDATFWATQEQNFPNRTISRNTYNTQLGVPGMAQRIVNATTPNSRNILIGQSMGGLAIREIDRTTSNIVGGAVTFDSPLDGANIADAIQDGRADQLTQHVADVLNRGPEASSKRSWFMRVVEFFTLQWGNLVRDGIGAIIHTVLNRVVTPNLGNLTNIGNVNDLTTNGNYINGVQNFSSSIPKIIVYGNEDDPEHVRIASSSVSNSKEDNGLVMRAYFTARDLYLSTANTYQPRKICIINCRKHRRISQAWRDGYNYLNVTFEKDWENLIGSSRLEERTYTMEEYICDIGPHEEPQTISDYNDCYNVTTYTTTVRVPIDNDGLVNVDTQRGRNSNWTNGHTHVEAEGVNHMEQGVHDKTRIILQRTFTGIYHPFFEGE